MKSQSEESMVFEEKKIIKMKKKERKEKEMNQLEFEPKNDNEEEIDY